MRKTGWRGASATKASRGDCGVEAAVQAGMYCIAVPNRFTVAQDFSRAHMRVPNLLTISTFL